MNRSPSARLRGAAAAVVLLTGTWPLRSQDQPAPPSGPPPARNAAADTLEAARDEIRGLEVGRSASSMSEGSLPRIAAPEWHGGAAPAPSVRPVRPSPAADARNPNWLLDALRQPDAAGVLAREREEARSDGPGARFGSDLTGVSRRPNVQTPADSRGGSERSPRGLGPSGAGTITNPLTAYLDDWMTPQDFALLKPGLSGRSAGVLPLPDFGPTLGGLTAEPLSSAGAFRGADPSPLVPAGDRPGAGRENPFLAALSSPVASVTGAVQTPRRTVPGPVPAAVETPSLQSPPSPPPVPRTPDFVRPAADERYFKPLKRF